jgi:pyridoxamine 5'-phosphate oxidase
VISKLRALLTFGRGVVVGLDDLDADRDPIHLFHEWFDAARRAGILLPEAMAVATATPDGVPSTRMMLCKGVEDGDFVFFTNYESRKSRELSSNPRAALLFHWAVLQRQVRVEGTVQKLTPEQSDAYFQTRPRGSRIGAWASHQSAPLADRRELDARVREFEERFANAPVPLPPNWGGFRLTPTCIEFWQGKANRLHDRLQFRRVTDGWTTTRLYP